MPSDTKSPSSPSSAKSAKQLKEEEKKRKKEEAKKLKEEQKRKKELEKQQKNKKSVDTKRLSGNVGSLLGVVFHKEQNADQIPMKEDELNEEFAKILDQLGVTEEIKKEQLAQPLKTKYTLYQTYKKKEVNEMLGQQDDAPQTLIEKFQATRNIDVLRKIQVLLRTAPIRWVNLFIQFNGISVISEALSLTNVIHSRKSQEDMAVQAECVACFRAILNTDIGMTAFLDERDAVRNLALILDTDNIATRTQTLFLLAIVCSFSNQGFALTLDAINHYKLVKREKTRLDDLVKSLRKIKDTEYRTNVLIFINTLMAYPPEDATRLSLMKEIKNLGLVEVVQDLKQNAEEELQIQINVFEETLNDDDFEFQSKVDLVDPVENARLLQVQLGGTDAFNNYINILHHMLIYSGYGLQRDVNPQEQKAGWDTLELVIKRAISSNSGRVVDVTPNESVLENRIKVQQSQIMDLEDQLIRSKKALEDAASKVQADITKLSTGVMSDDVKEKIKQLEDEKELNALKAVQLQTEIQTLEQINQSLEQVNVKLKSQVTKMKDEHKTLEAKLKELEAKNGPATSPTVPISATPMTPETQQRVDDLAKEIEEWRNKYKNMESKLQTKIDGLVLETEGWKKQRVQLMNDMETSKKKLDDMQKKLDDALKNKPAQIDAAPPTPTAPVVTSSAPPPPPPPPAPPAPMNTGSAPPPPPPPPFGENSASAPPPPPPPPTMGGPPPPPPPPNAMGGPPPPPPPMGQGGPPPPPPFGGPAPPPPFGAPMASPFGALPVLPKNKPTGNTRQFHFETIQKKDLKDSIFIKNKIAEDTSSLIKTIDLKELEALFTTKSKEETASAASDQPKKTEKTVISLLDSKRSYNISLQLGSLRGVTYEDIRKAIIVMDEKVVNDGNIGTLKAIAPTQEEIDLVANYSGEDELAEPDKFFRVMNGIPAIVDRLQAWEFKMKFTSLIATVRPDIENIVLACKELKESTKFVKFLGIVLTIGNFLNGKNANKQAHGFKLKTLAKLADTKSGDGKTSLLQYIVTIIDTKHKDLMDFPTTLEHIPSCVRILISGLEDDINESKKGIALVEKNIKTANDAALDGDMFPGIMKEFVEKAQNAISVVDTKWVEMQAMLQDVATLYNEDKKDLLKEPDKFFDVINNFLGLYKQAVEKNQKIKEAEDKKKKAEAKKLEEEQNRLKNQMKPSATKPTDKKDAAKPADKKKDGRGVVDDRGAALKNGTLLRKKRKARGGLDDLNGDAEGMDSNQLNSAFSKLK